MAAKNLTQPLKSNLPRFCQHWWNRLEASPLGYRLAQGTFWSLIGAAIARVLWLATSVLVARRLGKAGFGEFGIIQSTVGMFAIFAGMGMGVTASKHVAELRVRDPVRAGHIIALSSLMAWVSGLLMVVLLAILGPWLARHTLNAPQLGGLLRTGSLLLLLGALSGAQTGALSGFEAFKDIARINLYSGIALFPLMVAGVWRWGLEGAVWALVGGQAITCWLSYIAVKSQAAKAGMSLTYVGCLREWGLLWRFSLPALVGAALAGPVSWLCSTLLVNQPSGYEEMGVLNAANQWFTALLFLPSVLGQAVLPMLAEQVGNKDRASSARVLTLAIRMNALVVLPLVVAACLASPWIMASYGSEFRGAWPTLVVVLLTAGVLAVLVPVQHIITAAGRMWLGAAMNLGWGLCCFGLSWAFLRWGAFGLAGARLMAYLLQATWALWFAFHFARGSTRHDEGSKTSLPAFQPSAANARDAR